MNHHVYYNLGMSQCLQLVEGQFCGGSPVGEAEAHDTAKIHGGVYTRYSMAIDIFFPLSFLLVHLISKRNSSLQFDNGGPHIFHS